MTPVKSTLSSEFLSVCLQPKRNPGHPGRSAPPVSSSSALLRSPPPPPSTAAGASQTRRCLQPQPASPRGPRGEEGTGVCSAPVEQDPAFLRGRPVQGPAHAPVRAGVQPEFHVHTQASERRSQRGLGPSPADSIMQASRPSGLARSVGRLCCGNIARCHGNGPGASPVPPRPAACVSQTRPHRASHVQDQPGSGDAFGLHVPWHIQEPRWQRKAERG